MADTPTASEQKTELAKAYQPSQFEQAIYQRWLDADVFAPDGAGSTADNALPPFVIIQPPPNVTGSLHLGHAQRSAVEDLMIRHARMLGRPALWLPGLDHASIAAQVVLDRIIAAEGETRASLGRERYLERMWQFVETTRPVMLEQQRRVGASLDWGRLRFTMDEVSARAVRESFTRLYREGLAYRSEALINWCPGCRTSVSDLEVVPTPEIGSLWTIRYHLVGADGTASPDETIAIATTRPETLLGDTAVAVNPADPRYAALVGRHVLIPFVDRVAPIIADDHVEQTFGTGAVKITPAHDHDDYAMAARHGLPMVNVMDDEARINEVGGPFAGLERYDARQRVLAALEERGDLIGKASHEMVIGRCQRSNDVVEPRLKTQWFIRTTPLAAAALEATRSGRTTILPSRFEKVWENWLTNIRDWNVSRQLWWGHRIPAWYCPDGHVTVTASPAGPDSCELCGAVSDKLTQDPDIFDTWYSSGLWPFSTLGWPEKTADLARFYPGSVMETGYDIIFFWVARMMMIGILLLGDAPFHTVYLSGLVRDPYGQKMSKTRGNVVDPIETIDEFGADALQFALVHGTAPGNDLKLGRQKLENARNFANKLWNAARFVLGARPATIAADAVREIPDPARLGPGDRWLLSRTSAAVGEVNAAMADYGFGEAARILYDAIWSEYCDSGIELAKVRLGDATLPAADREATWWALVKSLDTYLRLLHPLMPFVTEALWGALPHRRLDPGLLIQARWPGEAARDPSVEAEVDALLELVRGIRNARANAKIDPVTWLPVDVAIPPALGATYSALEPAIARLARARPLRRRLTAEALHAVSGDGQSGDGGLSVIAGDTEAVIHLGAAAAEADELDRARLERELAQATAQLDGARSRLANDEFLRKAPPAVVDGARAREAELADQVDRLMERLDR